MRHIIASLLVAVALVMAACGGASAPAQSEGGTGQTQQASSGGEQQGQEDQGQESSPASSDSTQEQQVSTEGSSTSSSTSSSSAATTPVSTESSEVEEPELAAPTLPGIAPPDIYLNLEKEPYGFQFGGWQGDNILSKCGQSFDLDTGADLSACIYTDDVNRVVWIEAEVVGLSADAAEWLLPYVATAPFDGNDPEKAATWVKRNWRKVREGKPISTTIGPAKFELLGNGKTYVALEIKPAKGFEEWLASLE